MIEVLNGPSRRLAPPEAGQTDAALARRSHSDTGADRRRSLASFAAVFVGCLVVFAAAPARAQDTGVLLFTETEQIPLKTYAEFMRAGILRITSGAVKDIPTIDTFRMIRCSITGWRPVAVLVASEDLFKSEYAERRMIPIAQRPAGVTAVTVRVADLEDPQRIAELHRAIGRPEGGAEAYFFLGLSSGDMIRYYPFRMRQAAR